MVDNPRLAPVAAQVGDAPQGFLRSEMVSQQLFVAKAVLQGQQGGIGSDQRGDHLWQVIIGKGLEADNDQICAADFFRVSVTLDLIEVKVTIDRVDLKAVGLDRVIFSTHQEMDIGTVALQHGTVIKPQSTGANYRNFHLFLPAQ